MPAIPLPAAPTPRTPLMGAQSMFEHGDRVYIQTPVQRFVPTSEEVKQYAFSQAIQQEIQASGIKDHAPNENILWLKGRYVEGDNPNINGTAFRSQELRIKKLTPILMPITVMHDPRTAVGVIADSVLREPGKDGVTRPTVETVLAVWAHRFPEIAREAAVNLEQGSLMQSMECYSPWYECSECGSIFHKLPHGVERANWCAHLKAADLPDDSMRAAAASPELSQPANASRILGDVCFTGTGLIFGTRGAKGAFKEAYLEEFQDELAQHFQNVHTATATTSPTRSTTDMGLVQIEQSELDTLRQERDTARADATAAKTGQTAAETKVTELEAQVSTLTTEKDTLASEKTSLEEKANQATLKEARLKALGEGFKAKLATLPTTRDRLEAKAATCSDEDWDAELKVVEETAQVKRDDTKADSTTPPATPPADPATPDFTLEQIASAATPGTTPGQQPPNGAVSQQERSSVIGTLAGAFTK